MAAYEYLSLKDASDVQKKEMRKAFFFGAQHLFASVLEMLDPGMEPTQKDMDRMTLLDAELKKFTDEQLAGGGFAA